MCVRSGLEPTAAYMSEPTSSAYGLSLHRVGTSSVFVRFSFVDNGVCVGFTEFIPKHVSTLYVQSLRQVYSLAPPVPVYFEAYHSSHQAEVFTRELGANLLLGCVHYLPIWS